MWSNLVNRFKKEERGSVMEWVFVLMFIGVIVLYLFPGLRTKITGEHDRSVCKIEHSISGTEENPCPTPAPVSNGQQSGGSGGNAIITPTPKPKNCLEILSRNVGAPSGEYTVYNHGESETVMCDMATNGGGWTRLSNEQFVEDQTVPENSGLIIKESFITTNTNYTGAAPAGWYTMFPGTANGGYQWKSFMINEDKVPYTEVKMEVKLNFLWSVDSFSNTHGNAKERTIVEGQYMDGISVTQESEEGSLHLFSFTSTESTLPALDVRRSFIGSDYKVGPTINTTVTKKLTETSTDPIKVRIMLDQSWYDESIGIEKFVVWVR
jgi:hypothetical protein